MNGWVKIHRKLLKWGWFTDVNTSHFWLYCLLKANIDNTEYKGIKIKRGEFLEPIRKMAKESGLSTRGVRTALEHLKSTQEVTLKVTRYGTLVHVVKYGNYQDKPKQTDTRNDTRSDKQVTNNRHTTDTPFNTKEDKEYKKYKEEREESVAKAPCSLAQVKSFFKEKGFISDPVEFFEYYDNNQWVNKNGVPIKDWTRTASTWERREKKLYGSRNNTNKQKVGVPDFMKEAPEIDLDDLPF